MATATLQNLYRSGYTPGLVNLLTSHRENFAARIWILDNSGSMAIGDGYRIVQTSNQRTEGQRVTRWEELTQMVVEQAEVASSLNLFTEFHFLNDPGPAIGSQTFAVGRGKYQVPQEVSQVRNLMLKAKPVGVSPLQTPLQVIAQKIRKNRNQLMLTNRRVTVVIVTDGVPTDEDGTESDATANEEFLSALRCLEDLPVWVVVRLCTSEQKVVDFWNNLDAQVNLQLEVLDDHLSEAKEVARYNKWINYALPLHRVREMGCSDRVVDLVDERKLTMQEVRQFCLVVLGAKPENLPDPTVSWNAFVKGLQAELLNFADQWDPIRRKMRPWVDIKALNQMYGKRFLGRLKLGSTA